MSIKKGKDLDRAITYRAIAVGDNSRYSSGESVLAPQSREHSNTCENNFPLDIVISYDE
jgi:hypothetical protein